MQNGDIKTESSVEMDAVILGLHDLQKTLEAYFAKPEKEQDTTAIDALILEMQKVRKLISERGEEEFFKKFDSYLENEQKEKKEQKELFSELMKTLKEILGESKKKEQYEYEVEIDDSLKEKLKGKDGHNPIKGVDYFTSQDIQEITDSLAESLGTQSRGLIERTIKESLSSLDIAKRLATLEKEKKISFKSLTDVPDFESRIDDIYKTLERIPGHAGGTTSIFGLTDVDFTGTVEGQTYSVQRTKDGIKFVVGGGGSGVTDHGALTGLGDDDHPQYHNDARGDARYYTKTQLDGGQLNTLYYTIAQINSLLAGKSDVGHTHVSTDITDFSTAADARITAQKGVAGGLATLDGGGKVPSSQLPSYVDDILEYANLAAFPVTGTTGIIYVALDTNKIYRWSGSAYVEVSPGTGGSVSLTEVEIDFGTTPVSSKSFTITDGAVGPSNKILVFPSPNQATGRAGNDWEVDIASFTALAGTGQFTLTTLSPYLMVGKRKIYYQII